MKLNVINQIPPVHQKMERSSGSSVASARYTPEGVGNECPSAGLVSLANADFSALSVTTTDAVAMYFPKRGSSDTDTRRFSRIQTEQGNTYELMNTLTREDTLLLSSQHGMVWQGKTTIAQGAFGKVRFARNSKTNKIVIVKKIPSVLGSDGRVIENRARAEHEIKQMLLIQDRIADRQAWAMLSQFALPQDHAHLTRPVKAINGAGSVSGAHPMANKTYIFSEYASLGDGVDAIVRMRKLLHQGKKDEAQQLFIHTLLSYTRAVRDLHLLGLHHRDIKPDNFLHYAASRPTELEQIKLTDFGFTHDEEYRTQWAGETPMYAPPECKIGYRGTRYDALAHDSFSLGISILSMRSCMYPCDAPHSSHLHLKTMDGQIKDLTLKFYRNLGESASEKVRCMGVGSEHLTNLDMHHVDNIIAKLIATNKAERITVAKAYDLFSQLGGASLKALGCRQSLLEPLL